MTDHIEDRSAALVVRQARLEAATYREVGGLALRFFEQSVRCLLNAIVRKG